MSTIVIQRLSGAVIALTAVLFALGGAVVAFTPFGGLTDQTAGGLYYSGGVFAVLALAALFANRRGRVGWPGFVGFCLAEVGIVMYSTGMFLVLPLVENVTGAHDVFLFAAAEIPVFPVGAVLFFIGSAMLGFSIAAPSSSPRWRWGARLFAIGSLGWLLAFFGPSPANTWMLFASNLISGIGLVSLGIQIAGVRPDGSP